MCDALTARLRIALPDVIANVQAMLQKELSRPEAMALIREAEDWGLGPWAPVAEISSRLGRATRVLEQGQQACRTGDKEALREAMRSGEDLQLPEETLSQWRDNLKSKNLVMFQMKNHARRFRLNAEYSVAVRLVQDATKRPLKPDLLKRAWEKARAAGMPDEDLEEISALFPQVNDTSQALEKALHACDLDGMVKALDMAAGLSVVDPNIDACHIKVAHLASKVRMATEVSDLVELDQCLKPWRIPEEVSGGRWSSPDFKAILDAEATRLKWQGIVDEVEKRSAAGKWDAMQKKMDLLTNVHIDEAVWNKWSAALKREKNFTVMKAVSGAGVELKRKLYTMRLQVALRAASIPLEQLEEAADNAASRLVDASLIEKARAEVSAVRSRVKAATAAAARKHVDTAEVLFFKLLSGRVRAEEVESQKGPLWEMADALRAAEAAQDWESMQKVIEGWKEEKPGTQHAAFEREESPTRAFRQAQSRVKDLRLVDLRNELGACVDSLSKYAASRHTQDAQQELQHITQLARELLEVGWELTAPRRARLLALQAILGGGEADTGAARFGAALRTITDAARIVFVLDQTKAMKSDVFNRHLKPAVSLIADEIQKHAKGVLMGAVAYGPVKKVLDLTPDVEVFKQAVSKHAFADGREGPVAKSLRKAWELFKHDAAKASERDGARVVFHFTSRLPDKVDDAKKALNLLEAQGVIVVGVAVGPSLSEDALQEFSSPGLVFKVTDTATLQKFIEDAFVSMADVLTRAEQLTAEDTLKRLEEVFQ